MTSGQVQTQLTQAGFCILERFSSGLYLPLVAEFMGQFGLRLEQRLETKTRESLFDWLLWTQYLCCRGVSHNVKGIGSYLKCIECPREKMQGAELFSSYSHREWMRCEISSLTNLVS